MLQLQTLLLADDGEGFVPKLEVLAALQCQLCLRLARCAFQSQHNLLCGLCLLVENGFCLTTITGLFSVITTLSLGEQRSLIQHVNSDRFRDVDRVSYLSGLVLGDLVLSVLAAILAFAVSATGLWDVDLRGKKMSASIQPVKTIFVSRSSV